MNPEKYLRLGLIQTTIDSGLAWNYGSKQAPAMDWTEGEKAWGEICNGLKSIAVMPRYARPHVVILPELTIPQSREYPLRQYAAKLGVIIIAGLDFIQDGKNVYNQATVCIPSQWPFRTGSGKAKHFRFGKVTPSHTEREYISKCKTKDGDNCQFKEAEEVFILNLGKYGNVGLSICADFYDLQRYTIYRGRIQHLFLFAYNKDLESFRHIAESIARIVYCNVAICNTGIYGGSMVFYPAYDAYKRYIYRHEGARISSVQTVSLPVESLYHVQMEDEPIAKNKGLKSLPPGYIYHPLGIINKSDKTF